MLSPRYKPLASVAAFASIVCTTGLAEADYTDQDVAVPIRDAPDDLSGHFILAPKLAYLIPMGSAESRFSQRQYVGSGPAFGLDLAFGVSRYVAVQARLDYGKFSAGNDCPAGGACKATSLGFGLGADYHLVNGAAFDPWMRAGVGYRTMRYDLRWSNNTSELDYSGLEWLHLAVGGDWYPHSMLGFGPYLSLDVGSYGSRPTENDLLVGGTSKAAIHSFLSLGLRGVFDPMR